MSELFRLQPTERFGCLADLYARYRPTYPAGVFELLKSHCRISPGAVIADVGSGTGIFSRALAHHGYRVVGIEPNEPMRSQAETEAGGPTYQAGTAEATGLPDRFAQAVVSAQAFHWFEPQAALREFHRILQADGWVLLVWNERDETDSFTADYGEVIRTSPQAGIMEKARASAGETLLGHALFGETSLHVFRHEQILNEEALVGRALSVSYAPQEPTARERFIQDLRKVFRKYQAEDRVRIVYRTFVYLGKRVEGV